jgi:hypothetical protein
LKQRACGGTRRAFGGKNMQNKMEDETCR